VETGLVDKVENRFKYAFDGAHKVFGKAGFIGAMIGVGLGVVALSLGFIDMGQIPEFALAHFVGHGAYDAWKHTSSRFQEATEHNRRLSAAMLEQGKGLGLEQSVEVPGFSTPEMSPIMADAPQPSAKVQQILAEGSKKAQNSWAENMQPNAQQSAVTALA